MNKFLMNLMTFLAEQFSSASGFLQSVVRSKEATSKFVNLAPTDEADKTGVYAEAINFAISDSKVRNIALTGPYGSGKSSIIQSFLRKHKPRTLHISLAAFVPDEGTDSKDVTRQEIERSILQQMLYGADANRLPLSRFKRIQSPGVWSIFKSLYIVIGIASLWYVFDHHEAIFNGDFFDQPALSNWFGLSVFALAFIFVWTTIHHFYVASFGVSLKSVSLKDIEIRPAADDQESILNRHLDEIIYFFQSTDYDLVIIEDLDRFNDAEIFTTLREINSLVNANAGVKRVIRFLYALRDDMFASADRTKFFEFVIPVIPIINSSNSIDMVLKQGKRLELDERLDRQFLREVSRYLNDLRLIQNIFNEYAIYVSNLEADEDNVLNSSKLLAVLIYKNVFPKDFEHLHRGEGKFASILQRQEEFIRSGESRYRTEIAQLEQGIEIAERQTPADIKELRQIYAMAIIEKLPQEVACLYVDDQTPTPISKIYEHTGFEKLLEITHVRAQNHNRQNQRIDISGVQDAVDQSRSYQERKTEILGKASENKNNSLRKIGELRSKIASLRTSKLSELLRSNLDGVDQIFESFSENGELAKYLILEGHLDDTYYQYTSLFHSGRLSPNDNKYLIQIRAFFNPEPDSPVDNPTEVIAAMRDEDFGQSYVLNVKLVDCMLSDPGVYAAQLQKLIGMISSDFDSCDAFFDTYYSSGRHVGALLERLANGWKGLVHAVSTNPRKVSHLAELVATLPLDTLHVLANEFSQLSDSVSENLRAILMRVPELEPHRLQVLNIEVEDLAAIEDFPLIQQEVWEDGLFHLTIPNFEYAYKSVLGFSDLQPLRTMNYSTIRMLENPTLLDRAERDFVSYLQNIILDLPENSMETEETILDVVRRPEIPQDDLRRFLELQKAKLSDLSSVPEELHGLLFALNAIKPLWSNCIDFLNGEGFKEEVLVKYLDQDEVCFSLSEHKIPSGDEAKGLRRFLVKSNSLSDSVYSEYMRALPRQFEFVPDGLDESKIKILIEAQRIVFKPEVFEAISNYDDLQVRFVATNIDTYLARPDVFELDDDFREELLKSGIDMDAKFELVKLMDLTVLPDFPERAALVGPSVVGSDVSVLNLEASSVRALIVQSRPIATQVALLNTCHAILTDEELRTVLVNLPRPYSEIKTGYSIPRLKNTDYNLQLVEILDTRNIISSWSEGGFFSDDIRVNLFRS